tara:strand:- start:1039 stop:2841 length:1803 start_codon:yes stop_codon:yes gene_type:complete
MTEVYLNGIFVGTIDNPDDFIKQIKQERRKGVISKNLNLRRHRNIDEIHIESNRGRARRPLILVKEGIPLLTEKHIKQLEKKEMTWTDLVDQGIIEYIDAAEEEDCLIAFDERNISQDTSHMEISPLAMLGLTTSLVPYGNFNPSARLNAGSKNQKQALGFYAANYNVRMDMDTNILHYPQNPVVKTIMHEVSEYAKHPAGMNVIVAVMSYKGYNMEDAIVLNQGAIDRGLGRSTYFRPSVAEELRYSGGLMDTITVPDKDIKGYKSEKDYRFLEGDGIIYPEAKVAEEDVIIGKTSPPRFLSGLDEYNLASSTRRESSVALRHGEKGVVDFILISENAEGNKLVQVRVRDSRVPEIGDKFTSRHGQKGVIGMIVPHADMPFTSSGITPDILFSPHSIPSRMTVAHLLELIAGKTGAMAGRPINGTTFDGESEDSVRKELLDLGFRDDGAETMYDGATGIKYKARVFVGNMYYLKLKHMVANKIHSRGRGPIQLLTRQPTEGRAKEGGLRLGEMEKDTFIAHGAALLLKERFDSDKTVIPVSEETGLMGYYDSYHDTRVEQVSTEHAEINDIEISYAFKLLLDEFKSLGLYPKLILENKY